MARAASSSPTERAPTAPLTPEGRALHDRFVAAIDDDLDMPVALALLREILRAPLSDDERRWLILDADLVLGLDLDRVWDEPTEPRGAGRGHRARRGSRRRQDGSRLGPRRCPSG